MAVYLFEVPSPSWSLRWTSKSMFLFLVGLVVAEGMVCGGINGFHDHVLSNTHPLLCPMWYNKGTVHLEFVSIYKLSHVQTKLTFVLPLSILSTSTAHTWAPRGLTWGRSIACGAHLCPLDLPVPCASYNSSVLWCIATRPPNLLTQ